MTLGRLMLASLWFYRRTHLSVIAGVAVAAAVLTGALLVGDSVKQSLRDIALQRIGSIHYALYQPDRFVRDALAEDLESILSTAVAPALQLPGIVIDSANDTRVAGVQIIGVDERFDAMHSGGGVRNDLQENHVWLSEHLAKKLGGAVHSELLLRIAQPSALPRDAGVGSVVDTSIAWRVTVAGVIRDDQLGRFSLQANQVAPDNAFVNFVELQRRVGLANRANLIVTGEATSIDRALRTCWKPADAGLRIDELPDVGIRQLTSDRVFIDTPLTEVAQQQADGALGVLTYFVDELRLNDRETPYSMVAAIGPLNETSSVPSPVPPDMADGEILISAWLAEDLQASPGDAITLEWRSPSPGGTLEQRSRQFTVRAVLPMTGHAVDRSWTPTFEGLSDSENCRDWEPGIAIDLDRIREKDETYWDQYQTTPKAFVTLAAGREMWANRFGGLTAIRFPHDVSSDQIANLVTKHADPASIGLTFAPVRDQALQSVKQSLDFGQLFIGFSFFLIIAALILTGLLFVFGIEQRSPEIGLLLAVGFQPAGVRRLRVMEGGILAVAGSLLGAALAATYTRTILHALGTVWRDAVQTSDLQYHGQPSTLMIGTVASVCVSVLTIWLYTKRQSRRQPRELLTGERQTEAMTPRSVGPGLWLGVVSTAVAIAMVLSVEDPTSPSAAPMFFGGGALLLIAVVGIVHWLLARGSHATSPARLSVTRLGVLNRTRRRGRSLATVGLLAAGTFIVVAVGANKKNALADADQRSSGTGGFAFIGESTLPVLQDLNSPAAHDAYALDGKLLTDVNVVPFRVRRGDDASCLNLNRAQSPQLLGVEPQRLATLKAFTFARNADTTDDPWQLLTAATHRPDIVPAIGDQNTIMWGLGKSLGDELAYVDEQGETFQVKIVGLLAGSILQGGLIISEQAMLARYPSVSGYQRFLLDVPDNKRAEVADHLERVLADYGFQLTPAVERLAAFNAVENTYLSIFQILGGLGLLLGAAGLGMVVLRNVLERRAELAVLQAIGFRRRDLGRMILSEHLGLLVMGVASGVMAGVIAVLPALRSPGAQPPVVSMVVTVAAVFVSGLVWTLLATRFALRGRLLSALSNE